MQRFNFTPKNHGLVGKQINRTATSKCNTARPVLSQRQKQRDEWDEGFSETNSPSVKEARGDGEAEEMVLQVEGQHSLCLAEAPDTCWPVGLTIKGLACVPRHLGLTFRRREPCCLNRKVLLSSCLVFPGVMSRGWGCQFCKSSSY